MQINRIFEIKLSLTCQGQSHPKTIEILTKVFCISGPICSSNFCAYAYKNNKDLNQGLLHICSQFGDPSLNGSWVIARTILWLMQTRQTYRNRRRKRQYPKAKPGSAKTKGSRLMQIRVSGISVRKSCMALYGSAFLIIDPLCGWNPSGSWYNITMSSYQHKKSHCGDKTVVRSSYLHNGISYTVKMTSLYWFSPQAATNPFTKGP